MDQFPGNSKYNRTREEDKPELESKRVERVVVGEVVRRKKPMGSRIKESFIGDDSGSVGEYVLLDVIVPAIKDLISDTATEIVERMLFGDSRPAGRRGHGRRIGGRGTNYNAFSRDPVGRASGRDEPRQLSRRARAVHDLDEVILQTRVEANEILDRMFGLLEKYDAVTIADLYNMLGVTPEYTDEKYGWTDLRGSSISHTRQGGYLLNLPKPEQLER